MEFPVVKKIGIVAPARKISLEEIQPAIDMFNNWKIEVVLGKNLFSEHNQFAGTDIMRVSDFQKMINQPDIDAIIAARGGYGTARIIDKLNFAPLKNHFKWIIGYSDITVLHNRLHKLRMPSLHATMPINFPNNDADSLDALKQILMNRKQQQYTFQNHELNKTGFANAPLVGGNLSVLYSLRGTKYDLDVKGKILFIEDLDEYLYHIDRMITNLKLSGWFQKIKGLIIGGMDDMHDNTVPYGKSAREIIAEAVKDSSFPVAFINGIGHSNRNLPLVLGETIRFEVSKSGSIIDYALKKN